jgi:hypothetical protein
MLRLDSQNGISQSKLECAFNDLETVSKLSLEWQDFSFLRLKSWNSS